MINGVEIQKKVEAKKADTKMVKYELTWHKDCQVNHAHPPEKSEEVIGYKAALARSKEIAIAEECNVYVNWDVDHPDRQWLAYEDGTISTYNF